MIRFMFGVVVGIYTAQNYDVPNAKLCLDHLMLYLKEFEKNLERKDKK